MPARAKTPKVTGLKLTGLNVPLFPETNEEIYDYGGELARYLNSEKRSGKWLPYSKGAADMLRRWASKLPAPPPKMLREIAGHTEAIQFQALRIAVPIRNRRIDLSAQFELDIPTPETGVAYLLATVLSAGYGENLRQCLKHDCDLWFFDVPKSRRIKKYCCFQHGEAERQRRAREKKKAQKRRHRK